MLKYIELRSEKRYAPLMRRTVSSLMLLGLLGVISLSAETKRPTRPSEPHKSPTSLRNAALPPTMVNDICHAVTDELEGDGPNGFGMTHQDAHTVCLNSYVEFPALSTHSGSSQIEVTSAADDPRNGAHNGGIWLFRRVRDRAVLILDDGGVALSILESTHHGMYDLKILWEMGATTGMGHTVIFDGAKYQLSRCYDYNRDDEGEEADTFQPCPKAVGPAVK